MDEWKKRKTPRHQKFDYSSAGVYFITICTQNRRSILSRIVGTGVPDCPQTELTRYGEIADKYIRQLSDFYDHLSVEEYVIMPNHIHLLLWVKENGRTAIDGGQDAKAILRGRLFLQTLREQTVCALNLYRHLSVFVIGSTAKTFGNPVFTITLSEAAMITENM